MAKCRLAAAWQRPRPDGRPISKMRTACAMRPSNQTKERSRKERMAFDVSMFLAPAGIRRLSADGKPIPPPEKEAAIKADLAGQIDGMKKQAQVMVDSVFSFGELGFQEFETSKYLPAFWKRKASRSSGHRRNSHRLRGNLGRGKPVIALGSDIDDIPQASQKPGVAYHDPIIEGAPGHGEGHNSGMPLNIIAALAVKKVMERSI